ncbi:MAG: hypothetical protein JRG95_13715 [Deltaproteobacteria bacterium]|nr:hypothetical protein [Deltaproteobacteria bacterium]
MRRRFPRRRKRGDDGRGAPIEARWLERLSETQELAGAAIEAAQPADVPDHFALVGRAQRGDERLVVAVSPRSGGDALLAGLVAATREEGEGTIVAAFAPSWDPASRRRLGALVGFDPAPRALLVPGDSAGPEPVLPERSGDPVWAAAEAVVAQATTPEGRTLFTRALEAFRGLAAKHGGAIRAVGGAVELVILTRTVAALRADGARIVLELIEPSRSAHPLTEAAVSDVMDRLEGSIRKRMNDRRVKGGEEGARGRWVAALEAQAGLRFSRRWPFGPAAGALDLIGVTGDGAPVVGAARERFGLAALGEVLDAALVAEPWLPVALAAAGAPLRLERPRLLLAASEYDGATQAVLGHLGLPVSCYEATGSDGSLRLLSELDAAVAKVEPRAPRPREREDAGRDRNERGSADAGRDRNERGSADAGRDRNERGSADARRDRNERGSADAGRDRNERGSAEAHRDREETGSADAGADREDSTEEGSSEAREGGASRRRRSRGGRRRRSGGGGERSASASDEGAEDRDATPAAEEAPAAFDEITLFDLDDDSGDDGDGGRSRRRRGRGRRGRGNRGGSDEGRNGGGRAREDSSDDRDASPSGASDEDDLIDEDELGLSPDAPDLDEAPAKVAYEDEDDEPMTELERVRQEREERRRARHAVMAPIVEATESQKAEEENTGLPRGRVAILAHADRQSIAAAVLLARELRQIEGIWVYPQEELMTFFRGVATDLREKTPIYVIGFMAKPARDVIQAASIYSGRLVWFDHHEWPPEDLGALREAIGTSLTRVEPGAGSSLPLVIAECSRRSRFSEKLVDLVSGRFTHHDFQRWGRLWWWRLGEIAGNPGDRRSNLEMLLTGRPSDLSKEAAHAAEPPVPEELAYVQNRDFRLVHFAGMGMVVATVPPELDLHLTMRMARERFDAALSLARSEGEDLLVLGADDATGKRSIDLGSMLEHLAEKFAWVTAQPDADHVARFQVKDLSKKPERLDELVAEIGMGRSVLEG